VFSDHKAFLFDADKKLVIFPVSETKDANWQHVWQGVYVLRVKPDIGFVVQGKITHGTYDPHPGQMIRASLAPYLPHLEYREWERCGHQPWGEKYVRDEFFAVLRAWLAQQLAA